MTPLAVPVFVQRPPQAWPAPAPLGPARTPACMGGWCLRRSSCAHYHATGITRHHAEDARLCPPGTHQRWQPIAGH